MEIASIFRRFFTEFKTPRLRDRKEHYASSIMSDLRDQYWALIGEPETNPSDTAGRVKMFLGNAIEKGLKDEILSNLHFFGLHLLGTQTPAGLENPNFNMYYDAVVRERNGSAWGKKYILEVKSKSGIGADMFMRSFDPGESYMAQMALYLHTAHLKGLTDEGIFLFVPLSNDTVGDIVFIYCKYDETSRSILAYNATTLSGHEQKINFTFSVDTAIERAKIVDEAVKNKITPKGEFTYKFPLTPEYLGKVSDFQLEKAAKGNVVLGDWQVKYSRWKDLILKLDGVESGYSKEELAILTAEYKRRHPKSKKF
jgi:hypothetical protein